MRRVPAAGDRAGSESAPVAVDPVPRLGGVPTVRLFAAVRVAAGTGRDVVAGETVGEVLDAAVQRYGDEFGAVVQTCRVWVNGEPADLGDRVAADDEVAFLPPVSGG